METRRRPTLTQDLDELASVPLVFKDTLRGLRKKLSDLPPVLRSDLPDDAPLSPLALAVRLVRETRRIASLGEDLARDVLLHGRDEARIAAFSESGFHSTSAGRGEHSRHAFVASRYAAAKFILVRFGYSERLVLEHTIDRVWRGLRDRFASDNTNTPSADPTGIDRIAATTWALAQSGAVAGTTPSDDDPMLAPLVFATLGLAEAILALSPHPTHDTTLAALELAGDVMRLRSASIVAIVEGFDPEAQLAAEYRLLAPPLTEH